MNIAEIVVLGGLCHCFLFFQLIMLSGGEKSVLPAGHLSTCTLFLRSNCFDSCSILFLALSFSDLLKKDVVWMTAYFAQYIKICFSHDDSFPEARAAISIGIDIPPYHQRYAGF